MAQDFIESSFAVLLGIGAALVKGKLEFMRGEGLKIAPVCPFISVYLRRHPEYKELVD